MSINPKNHSPLMVLLFLLINSFCAFSEEISYSDSSYQEIIGIELSSEKKLNPLKHSKKTKWTLSAAMVFQDEASYLKEWVEFHKLVGVEHFYLYNNLSTDSYLEVLEPYIRSGEVELTEWPYEATSAAEWDSIQNNAYRNALTKAKSESTWLAIIDSDEFLVPVLTDSIPLLLKKYEKNKQIGGVFAYWVVFGTSYIPKIPDDRLLIETLVMNGGPGKGHFKSIIQPSKTLTILSPHHAQYLGGFISAEILHSELQINHYWSRDEWFLYNIKIPRREKWGTPAEVCVHWAIAQNNDTPEGKVILRFTQKLREKMGY